MHSSLLVCGGTFWSDLFICFKVVSNLITLARTIHASWNYLTNLSCIFNLPQGRCLIFSCSRGDPWCWCFTKGLCSLMLCEVALRRWFSLIGLKVDSCVPQSPCYIFWPWDALPRGVLPFLAKRSSSLQSMWPSPKLHDSSLLTLLLLSSRKLVHVSCADQLSSI